MLPQVARVSPGGAGSRAPLLWVRPARLPSFSSLQQTLSPLPDCCHSTCYLSHPVGTQFYFICPLRRGLDECANCSIYFSLVRSLPAPSEVTSCPAFKSSSRLPRSVILHQFTLSPVDLISPPKSVPAPWI